MIRSTTNPLVKDLVKLRTRRHRDRTGLFVIEGYRPLQAAIHAGAEIVQQVICPDLGGSPVSTDIELVELAEAPFRKVSIRQGPDGVLGVARRLAAELGGIQLPGTPLILVIESIEKPGNLGAMLRSADAFGADAVVVTDPATDIHNPSVIRASQGALFTVPLAVAPLGDTLSWLRTHDVSLVAAIASGRRVPAATDLTRPVALAVGSEADGLSPEIRSAADDQVTIPMRGSVDSLNASVASAILLYEARRQRSVL